LGLGNHEEIYPIAAVSGSGTGDLLDDVIKEFQEEGMKTLMKAYRRLPFWADRMWEIFIFKCPIGQRAIHSHR
jgi:predicted GTPase